MICRHAIEAFEKNTVMLRNGIRGVEDRQVPQRSGEKIDEEIRVSGNVNSEEAKSGRRRVFSIQGEIETGKKAGATAGWAELAVAKMAG